MCGFITQHNPTMQVLSFDGLCKWHADCRNVHLSYCPWIECSFIYHKPSPTAFQRIWHYIQQVSQPQATCHHTAQDLHIQHLHLQNCLRPANCKAAATIALHNQRISAKTVRNHLREAHLHACCSHLGLDLTAVRWCTRLESANAHIRWCLALRRGVPFADESQFWLSRSDGRQCVWRCVGEQFGV